MTKSEFKNIINILEKSYVREMSFLAEVQYKNYFNGIFSSFQSTNFRIFKKAIEKHIKVGKNLPLIPELAEIINSIQRNERLEQQKESVACSICNSNGLVPYYRYCKFGYWAEYIAKCICDNASKYDGSKIPVINEIEEQMKENKYIRFKIGNGNYTTHPDDFKASDDLLKTIKKEFKGMSPQEILSNITNKILNK